MASSRRLSETVIIVRVREVWRGPLLRCGKDDFEEWDNDGGGPGRTMVSGTGRAAWVKCHSEAETLLLEDSAH